MLQVLEKSRVQAHSGTSLQCQFFDDDRRIVSCGKGTIAVSNAETGDFLFGSEMNQGITTAVAASEDGRCVVAGGSDGTIAVLDMQNETQLYRLDAHDGVVRDLEIDDSGQFCVSGGEDGIVACWGLQERASLWKKRLKSGQAWNVRFIDKELIVSASRSVRFWTVSRASAARTLPEVRIGAPVMDIDVLPEKNTLLLALNTNAIGLVKVGGTAGFQELGRVDNCPTACRVHPNGEWCVVGDSKGMLTFFAFPKGEVVGKVITVTQGSLPQVRCVSMSKSGRLFCVTDENGELTTYAVGQRF